MIHIALIHWIADFIVQTRYQGHNKSKDNKALLAHTTSYTLCWLALMPWYGFWNTIIFMAITFVCHTITDYFTSRGSSYCWEKFKEANKAIETIELAIKIKGPWEELATDRYEELVKARHRESNYEGWFWAIIGFDQALHIIQLFLTNKYLS